MPQPIQLSIYEVIERPKRVIKHRGRNGQILPNEHFENILLKQEVEYIRQQKERYRLALIEEHKVRRREVDTLTTYTTMLEEEIKTLKSKYYEQKH